MTIKNTIAFEQTLVDADESQHFKIYILYGFEIRSFDA